MSTRERTEMPPSGSMWNRPVLFLRVSIFVKKEGKRGFSIKLFLPLFLLLQWIDIAEDLLAFFHLFSRHGMPGRRWGTWCGFHLEDGIAMIKAFVLQLILHTGRTDIADIDVESEGRRVMVKCLLR